MNNVGCGHSYPLLPFYERRETTDGYKDDCISDEPE